jgi:hypothetical protein
MIKARDTLSELCRSVSRSEGGASLPQKRLKTPMLSGLEIERQSQRSQQYSYKLIRQLWQHLDGTYPQSLLLETLMLSGVRKKW